MKDVFELSATAVTNVKGGTQLAGYTLQPVKWLKEIIGAAKVSHFHAQFAKQGMVDINQTSMVFPYQKEYKPSGDFEDTVAENTTITWTTLDTVDGVEAAPADQNAGIKISERALRTNALDLVREAREQLTYYAGDKVDLAVRDALVASTNQAATATRGAYTVYGGDARADSELAAGDVITPDMVVDAKVNLTSSVLKYWVPGTPAAEAISSVTANTWKATSNEPFVLIIAPEQSRAFLKDSQFMNASEYGGNEILMEGEIGKYVGCKVIETSNTKSFTAAGTAADGGGVAGATGHRCVLFKALKAMGLAWGSKPRLRVFDYTSDLSKRMVMDLAYAAVAIQKDAICNIDVADV